MDLIEKEFGCKAVIRGRLYFYRPDDAIAVIEKCKQYNMRVLGIDAFICTNDTTQPVSEHSVDYSWTPDSWPKAAEFIRKRADLGLVFEIVYDDPPITG